MQSQDDTQQVYVGAQLHALRCTPWPALADGKAHHAVALGCTIQELTDTGDEVHSHLEQECLTVLDVSSTSRPLQQTGTHVILQVQHTGGRVTCLERVELHSKLHRSRSIHVLSGSYGGYVSALLVQLPDDGSLSSGAIDEVTVHGVHAEELPGSSQYATSGRKLHEAAVTAVCTCADSQDLATAGLDGRICVLDSAEALTSMEKARVREVAGAADASHPCLPSVLDAAWLRAKELATVSTAGGVQVWDVRCFGRPVRECEWRGHEAEGLTCVVAHPARPQQCFVGHASGAVSMWDLRFAGSPVVVEPPAGGYSGAVVGIAYDEARSGHAGVPVVAGLAAGHMLELDLDRQGPQHLSSMAGMHFNGSGLCDFDVVPSGQTVFACTDQEELAIVDRSSRL